MKFGTSLCWWTNIEYPEDTKSKIIDLLFGEDGLQLTVVRYNLGGGENPNKPMKLRPGGMVPCVKKDNTSDINLNNDKRQKDILDLSIKAGVSEIELFVNSPPWWMTVSGCTSGTTSPFHCNLRKECIEEYADFLVSSYNMFKSQNYNIVSLEPFNEPSNPFWTTSLDQEGCFFPYTIRNKVLKTINKIDCKIPLTDSDEFSSGFALCRYLFTPKNSVSKVNVHGYKLKYKNVTFHLDDLDVVRKTL